jgi:5'-deoxynucleotidase YfbR-like HD superfamily hydrolase
MQSLNLQALATREGGMVERCHAMPKHGAYNVAMHSYNAVSLLLLLHPSPSITLIKAVLWHDVAERWTGDIPRPAKWASPDLNKADKELEMEIMSYLQLYEDLTEEEKNWLGAVDLLELFMWTCDETALGNASTIHMRQRLIKLFNECEWMPRETRNFVMNFTWKRLPDCDELLNRSKI